MDESSHKPRPHRTATGTVRSVPEEMSVKEHMTYFTSMLLAGLEPEPEPEPSWFCFLTIRCSLFNREVE